MKIGIFTLHSNVNFGGGLQQIALFEVLKSFGHEPQIVCVQNDFPKSAWRRFWGVLSAYNLKGIVKEVINRFGGSKQHPGNYELYKRCDAFNYANLNYTPKFGMAELPVYCKHYDAIIVGSDQVWTDVYSKINPYFCDGVGNFQGIRISYAACSAHEKVPIYNRKHIRKSLSLFSAISVRDVTTARLVERLGNQKPIIVADPTFLYDFKKYIKPSSIEEPYIFAYVLGNKSVKWHTKNIKHIRSKVGNIKVVALTTEIDDFFPWADIVLNKELSVDWMNILRESQFVYTDSFHAVIFAMKFHKNFVAYYGDLVRSSRMLSLIQQFKLEDRIVREPCEVDYEKSIDYIGCDKIIENLKITSIEWLKQQLITKKESNE